MKRRAFLRAGCACAGALLPPLAGAQEQAIEWDFPPRFTRPDIASDEGGLWAMMDRAETRLRRSPFAIRDHKLHAYVEDIACRLGASHCPDIRVHIVRTPWFNASMAPNGMMQVWSGLLLRADNEAQLAAVLGHEIGHYISRHSVERLRDARSRAAFGQFLGLFGVAGLVGQVGVLAGMLAYSRDHEREADRIGAILMQRSGYDVSEAAKVWANLLLETKARPQGTQESIFFATHPGPEEREAALAEFARAHPGGETNQTTWQQMIAPFVREWLGDEVRRGQYEESVALLGRALSRGTMQSEYFHARGEAYRLRAGPGDLEYALADFSAAIAAGNEPPQTHRSVGLVQRARKQMPEAKLSFRRYLELDPQAPDAPMIRTYLEEAL
ncbi:MAG TPA: M48 family metallopeptidase [Burkholderiales bacterium]